jgi:uncharacterized protein YkwD
MAFTIRGSVGALNKASKRENKNGFQEVSAPGPRQGVGGQSVSLLQAEKMAANETNGATAKCSPITQKASPLKINNTLVQGAGDAAARFVDVRSAMGRGISETYN